MPLPYSHFTLELCLLHSGEMAIVLCFGHRETCWTPLASHLPDILSVLITLSLYKVLKFKGLSLRTLFLFSKIVVVILCLLYFFVYFRVTSSISAERQLCSDRDCIESADKFEECLSHY